MVSSQNQEARRVQPLWVSTILVSFCILFLEMSCIRWFNATVQVLSYFSNLILLSSFLGLGAGCMLASRQRRLILWFGPVFLLMTLAATTLGSHGFSISYDGDVIFVDDPNIYESALSRTTVPATAVLAFIANLVFFILPGQELARLIAAFKNPLRGYSYDIAGSLSGTLAFALLAYLQTPPWIWFAIGLLALLSLIQEHRVALVLNLVTAMAGVWIVSSSNPSAQWSPYYKVDVRKYHFPSHQDLGFMILVDNLRIQDALKFSPELRDSELGSWIPYYALPYRISKPKSVLILGAGSGNEGYVAAAAGVSKISAVEIDPVIASIGRFLHPMQPYNIPQVHLVVDDARAFLSRTDEKYDLIVLSALDSHKQVSGLSSLRLESFVYTEESYAAMRRHLAPGGLLCLNLSSSRHWMASRTYFSLAKAFGRDPQLLKSAGSPFNSLAYVETEDGHQIPPETLAAAQISTIPPPIKSADVRLATDDWPFLYLEKNAVPSVCLVVIASMLVLASLLLVGTSRGGTLGVNAHFFLLGAGFMLLEARSVTQMALMFGTTWYVNAVVVASILVAIMVTNACALRGWLVKVDYCYLLLMLSLVGLYFFPYEQLLRFHWPVRVMLSGLSVGFPVVWASFIFSQSFGSREAPEGALGANLLGVVLGGALEYGSNVFGMDSLYLVALAIYAASYVVRPRSAVVPAIQTDSVLSFATPP